MEGFTALLGAALLVLPLVVGRWLGMRSGVVVEGGRGEIAASAAGAALTRASAAPVSARSADGGISNVSGRRGRIFL